MLSRRSFEVAMSAKLPVTEVVAKFYDEISGNGGQRWDTSSLITRL